MAMLYLSMLMAMIGTSGYENLVRRPEQEENSSAKKSERRLRQLLLGK
jgi:hypothetical protein